mmetsp:Transcript_31999/g.51683  ORF Transcript_31999/g.51683 Transcript_31999/m.51683 type:complete len:267 (-) Transcript_31999:552-1352(-)
MSGLLQRSILFDVVQQPVTTCVIAICCAICLYCFQKGLGYEDVGINLERILRGEWWRMLTSSLTHISLLHLLFNMSSTWNLGFLEVYLGPWIYIKYSLILLFLSSLLTVGVYYVLADRFHMERYLRVYAVGYSCVVFGWMTISAILQPTSVLNFFGLQLPISYAPFGSLILTSILVPQASFLGHLAGIIIGLGIGWGLFEWVTTYWFANYMLWSAIITVASAKQSGQIDLPFISLSTDIEQSSSSTSTLRMENGILTRTPSIQVQP